MGIILPFGSVFLRFGFEDPDSDLWDVSGILSWCVSPDL